MRIALKTIAGLYDGATTRELDELSIRTASSFMVDEPAYSKLAARLLAAFIDKEVEMQGCIRSRNRSAWGSMSA
jgi:ribonucleoside-diphosphate reductase alpha chain